MVIIRLYFRVIIKPIKNQNWFDNDPEIDVEILPCYFLSFHFLLESQVKNIFRHLLKPSADYGLFRYRDITETPYVI